MVGTASPQELYGPISLRGGSRNPAFMPATVCGDLVEVGGPQEHKTAGQSYRELGELQITKQDIQITSLEHVDA